MEIRWRQHGIGDYTRRSAEQGSWHCHDLVDLIHYWSKANLFEINCDMTKELTISFSRQYAPFSRACIDKSSIESVQREKLLGVMINANLTWDDHTVGLGEKSMPVENTFLFNWNVHRFLLMISISFSNQLLTTHPIRFTDCYPCSRPAYNLRRQMIFGLLKKLKQRDLRTLLSTTVALTQYIDDFEFTF